MKCKNLVIRVFEIREEKWREERRAIECDGEMELVMETFEIVSDPPKGFITLFWCPECGNIIGEKRDDPTDS